jgi:hypothetical protein
MVSKTILSGPHYGFCVSTLSIKNYYYDYYYVSNFGNIFFSISNTVIAPVLAIIAVESAKVSTWQCDLYLPVYTYTGSNPGGGEIFRTCPDGPWGPPSLLYNGYRIFPGVKSGRGVTLTPHLLLVPWSWKSRAVPLFPLWAVRPVQSLSACTRVNITYSYTLSLLGCIECF